MSEAERKRLEARGISVHFDAVKALDGVDLELDRGEILGLIGPNGAGKTTLMNVVSGLQPPTAGSIHVSGVDVTGWAPHRIARAGLGRTFQNVRLFGGMTVLENVEAGAVGVGLGRRTAQRFAWELLERMDLADRAGTRAAALPYGDERRLSILRSLASAPDFLLLDEPAAGLNEGESDELMRTVRRIRDDFGCGVLMIEHDMRVIMQLCERIHVIDHGKTISIGRPDEVRADPAVITAYLGTKGGAAVARD